LPSVLASNLGNPSYCATLVAELIKRIHQLPAETPPKEDKLVDRVARCNPKVYNGSYDPVEGMDEKN